MPLNWKLSGEGPPLLLLHGLFGSLENLGALSRALSDHFSVYSVDLPNHGKSSHIPLMSLPGMAAELIAWVADQGLSDIRILGHSLGGKVAMEMALTRPDHVKRLVVMDIAPVDYPPSHDAVFAGLAAIEPDRLDSRRAAEDILAEHVTEPAVRIFLLKNLVRSPSGHFSWRINLPVILRDYPNLSKGNTASVYRGPTLFIKGEQSDYLLEKYSDVITQLFPAAQLKVVAGTGHWLHAEKPAMVAGIAKRFLMEESAA